MTRHVIIVGAQRCGTTLLYEILDAHPHIEMAKPRRPEPKFFLSDDAVARGYDWYRSTYFAQAGDDALLGEKSTSYLEHPSAANRIVATLADVKILVQLRDPVQRAISNWQFSKENGRETRPLEVALAQNLHQSAGWDDAQSSVSPFAYLERGHYLTYLRPWLDVFGDSLSVRFLEEQPQSPAQVRSLYGWLGVATDVTPPPLGSVNASTHPAPALADELVGQLRDHFAPSDASLAACLGRSLPWQVAVL